MDDIPHAPSINISSNFNTADETKSTFDTDGHRRKPRQMRGAKTSGDLIQYKCILSGFLSDIIDVDFSDSIKMKIMNTLFYHFLKSPRLVVGSYLLDDICSRYVVNGDTFQLGTKRFICTNEDFRRILGLPFRSRTVNIREVPIHHNTFYNNRLHGYKLSRTNIRVRMRKLSQDRSIIPDEEDNMVQMCICLLLVNAHQTFTKKLSYYLHDIIDLWRQLELQLGRGNIYRAMQRPCK